VDTFQCTVCRHIKPVSDFPTRNGRKRPHRSICRMCIATKNKTYRADHHVQRYLYQQFYRRKNFERDQEKNRQRHKAWRLSNIEYVNARQIRYNAENAEKKRAYSRAYGKTNRTSIRIKENIAYHAHPERFTAKNDRARARKYGAPISDLTASQWREILAAYGYRCVYCDRKMTRLTKDHIIPLSKGGNHSADNVVPACRSCNSSKQAGPPLKPVQPLLLTIAHAKKKKA
jgi:5-methylcytosine-specific restriction endonuclease McrA